MCVELWDNEAECLSNPKINPLSKLPNLWLWVSNVYGPTDKSGNENNNRLHKNVEQLNH